MASMELVLLGTGSPLPNPDRCGAGQVVIAGDTRVMVDCGWGAARRLPGAGIPPPRVDAVLYTHLHSDHITDTPDLLIMRWAGGARKPLRVFGPVGTKAMMDGFLAAMSADIGYRFAHHPGKLAPEGIVCEVTEIPATPDRTPIVEIDGLAIEAFEVDHILGDQNPRLGDGHGEQRVIRSLPQQRIRCHAAAVVPALDQLGRDTRREHLVDQEAGGHPASSRRSRRHRSSADLLSLSARSTQASTSSG